MDGTVTAPDIKPGMTVLVVTKQDQPTGRLTKGVVKDILTPSPTHPHGIKVRLQDGVVGRVKKSSTRGPSHEHRRATGSAMSFVEEIRKEFEPKLLLPSLTVGLLAGVMDLGMEISLAALIFADLHQFLAGGIGVMLFGALVMGLVVGLTTSVPGMVAVPQDTPAAILALAVGGIALDHEVRPAPGRVRDGARGHRGDVSADGGHLPAARAIPPQRFRTLHSLPGRRRIPGGHGLAAGKRRSGGHAGYSADPRQPASAFCCQKC